MTPKNECHINIIANHRVNTDPNESKEIRSVEIDDILNGGLQKAGGDVNA